MLAVPPPSELRKRLATFREMLARKKLAGALISDPINVRYLSGFTGEDSALLITPKKRLILTDFRYIEEAQQTAKGWRRKLEPPGLMEKAGEWARKLRLRNLGFEGSHLSVRMRDVLRKKARGVRLSLQQQMAEEQRIIKSAWELEQIQKALRIQERCFLEVCPWLKAGIREADAGAEIRYRMVRAGADDQAFACMFQWASSSSLPHGRPTARRLRLPSIVLIDWGARYCGYHADLTRTFFIGNIPPRLRRIHEVVAEAQRRAIAKIAPEVPMADVDAAARDYIRKAGFGKYFGHSTGHGIGLKIHEAPSLSSRSKGKLKPGMVVTVEPGIYLSGLGGVRVEDDILVTPQGNRKLSRLPVGLRWNGNGA